MCNIDKSRLRYNVGSRFLDGEDVKKLGKIWIVRKEATRKKILVYSKMIKKLL